MRKMLLGALISVSLSGCAVNSAPNDVLAKRSPVDAQVEATSSYHQSIIGEYFHRIPVEPKPWRKLNDDQAPKSGTGS
jgi:hypothetical protein